MLFTNIGFPVSYVTASCSIVSVSLGFPTSMKVVDIFSILYPLIYAFPGDTWIANKSSAGILPPWVSCSDVYTPLFPTESFKDSFANTSKGLI